MENFFRFLNGYLTAVIRGEQIERFLNLCRSKEIFMKEIRYQQEQQITAQISVKDFFLLRPIRNKTGVHIQITGKHGMPFFFFRNKKRKAFFAGVLLGSLLLFGLSGRIWNIHIEGNCANSTSEILDFLKEKGIVHTIPKRKVNCSEIAAAVRRQFPETVWVSARIEGIRLILEIKEGISKTEEIKEDPETVCDLAAEKDGIITEMVVRRGTPVKKTGDVCKTGDILVSGEIPIMNDSQEIVRYDYVHADADIFISRSIAYYQEIPLKYKTERATGEIKQRFFIRAGSWYLGLSGKYDKNWRILCQELPLYLTENFKLPFSLGKIELIQYQEVTGKYTEEEVRKKALLLFRQYEKKLLKQGIFIEENHVTETINGTSCINRGTLKIVEKTGKEKRINKKKSASS